MFLIRDIGRELLATVACTLRAVLAIRKYFLKSLSAWLANTRMHLIEKIISPEAGVQVAPRRRPLFLDLMMAYRTPTIKPVLQKLMWMAIAATVAYTGNAYAAASDECAPGTVVPDIRIEITRNAEGAVADYRLSEPVSCLRLADAGPVRKLTWKMLTAGARLNENGNAIVLEKPQSGFQVLLRPFQYDGQIDRTYSPVINFGDGSAAAVYSVYLQGADRSGKTTFEFSGFSPFAQVGKVGRQSEVAGEHPGYLIIGDPLLVQDGKASFILDRALPVWLKTKVTQQLHQGVAAVSAVAALPLKTSYLLTYTDPRSPGAGWRGDALHHSVRLNFFGEKWQREDPEIAATISRFALHELFHLANHQIRPAQPGNGLLSLLEGGAEAAAVTLLHRSGELNDTAFAAEKDAAMLRCLKVPGDTLATKERINTRTAPYACGEVLQYLAAAIVNKKSGQADVLTIWKAFLSRQNGEAYGWDEFFAALRQQAAPDSLKQISMLEKLATGTASWHETLEAFEAGSFVRKPDDAEMHTPQRSAFYAESFLQQMLVEHCNGRSGTIPANDGFVLDAPPDACSGVPDKFRVVAINGHRLANEGHDAYREQIRRCAAGESTELKDDHGEVRTVNCSKAVSPIQLYSFNNTMENSNK